MLYQKLTKKAVWRGCFTILELVSRADALAGNTPVIVQEKRVDGIVVIGTMDKDYLLNLEQNAEVPSVVGFDNYLYPGTCDINITTYEVDISEMARRTIHKILKKIPGKGDNGFGRNGVLNIPKCMVLEIRYQKVLSFPAYMMESDHVNAWNP